VDTQTSAHSGGLYALITQITAARTTRPETIVSYVTSHNAPQPQLTFTLSSGGVLVADADLVHTVRCRRSHTIALSVASLPAALQPSPLWTHLASEATARVPRTAARDTRTTRPDAASEEAAVAATECAFVDIVVYDAAARRVHNVVVVQEHHLWGWSSRRWQRGRRTMGVTSTSFDIDLHTRQLQCCTRGSLAQDAVAHRVPCSAVWRAVWQAASRVET
jgi:hypothetical protein